MNQPQFIRTEAGEELVVLARKDYDALLAALDEAAEDAADVAMYDKCKAELLTDPDGLLPGDVSMAILRGDSLLKALRNARGMSQVDLAARAGIAQGYLSDLENKRKTGTADTLERLAKALAAPVKWFT